MRKFLKLFFSLILVLGFTFSLAACGATEDDGGKTPSGENQGGEQGGDTSKDELKVDVAAKDAGLSNMLGSGKLYVTTFGQADRAYLREMIDEVEGEGLVEKKISDHEIEIHRGEGEEAPLVYTFHDQLKASDVEAGSLVIAVVGYTSKGIAAEITQTGEVARAKAFAEKEGIKLVIVQLSGKARRGDSSDGIIEAATKGADLTLIYDNGDKTSTAKGADYDGKFSTEWCKGKALFAFSDEWEMTTYFKVILGL